MKAVTVHGKGDLRLDDRAETLPGPGEVPVRLGAGGICGSDMSYLAKGGVGDFKICEPLVVGHEISGTVEWVGADGGPLAPGTRVAVDPSRTMRFFGSAALFPHVQGAFSEKFVCRADQCHPIPDGMDFRLAALAEPFAVALHGLRRAGEVFGKHVIVTGAGPIGMLTVLAARHAGAASVTITDLVDEPLVLALAAGADTAINVAQEPERLAALEPIRDISISAWRPPAHR